MTSRYRENVEIRFFVTDERLIRRLQRADDGELTVAGTTYPLRVIDAQVTRIVGDLPEVVVTAVALAPCPR
jgi:hypothetical protein